MKKILIILVLLFTTTIFAQEKQVDTVLMKITYNGMRYDSSFPHVTKKGDTLWVEKYYDKDSKEYVKFSKLNDSLRFIISQKTLQRRKLMFNKVI